MFTILCLVITLLLIFLALFLKYMSRNYSHWKKKDIAYFEPKLLFGNVYELCTQKLSIGEIMQKFYQDSKSPFKGFYTFDHPAIIIRNLEIIKHILVKDFDKFYDRSLGQNQKDDLVGCGLLFSGRQPFWKSGRKVLNPSFTTGKIKNSDPIFKESLKDLISYLNEKVNPSEIIDVREAVGYYILHSIFLNFYGSNMDFFKDENIEIKEMMRKLFSGSDFMQDVQVLAFYLIPEWVNLFRLKFVNKKAAIFMRNVFEKMIDIRKNCKTFRNDVVDLFARLKNGEELEESLRHLDIDQAVGLTAQILVAGFETSTVTTVYALYELAKNQNIQDKLREELLNNQEDNEISYETLQSLKYLDKCVSETLRMYPILGFLDRRCNSDYKIPGTDKIINKGTSVFISILGIHYDSEYYPDPHKFDPERFNDINSRPQMAYLPFGDGPRHCIGKRYGLLSVKNALAAILTKFSVHLCEETQHVYEKMSILTLPKGGLKLKLIKISNKNLS